MRVSGRQARRRAVNKRGQRKSSNYHRRRPASRSGPTTSSQQSAPDCLLVRAQKNSPTQSGTRPRAPDPHMPGRAAGAADVRPPPPIRPCAHPHIPGRAAGAAGGSGDASGASVVPVPNAVVRVLEGRNLAVSHTQWIFCSRTYLSAASWRSLQLGRRRATRTPMPNESTSRGFCHRRNATSFAAPVERLLAFNIQGQCLDGHSDCGKLLLHRLREEAPHVSHLNGSQ